MKALTFYRPWPHAIFEGSKRIENRDWAPSPEDIGSRIAIHAGKSWDGSVPKDLPWDVPQERNCPAGVVVGTVHLVGVHDMKGCMVDDCPTCKDPWAFGPWLWLLERPLALATPIPCRGYQKLWDLPPGVEREVRTQGAA